MKRETQSKALAGAAVTFLVALVPILLSEFTGTETEQSQFETLSEAVTTLMTLAGALVVGWLGVYFAPRNKPIQQ